MDMRLRTGQMVATRQRRRLTGQVAGVAAALAGLLAGAGAEAQTLMCGSSACADPWDAAWNVSGSGPYASTGIDDLKLAGGYWDVTFTQTRPSKTPFVLSTAAAKPGQPLTGFDANEALLDFYGSLPNGGPGSDPHDGPALITAFGPGNYYGSKTAGYDIAYLDIGPYTLPNGVNTGPSHGYSEYVAAEYGVNEPISALAWSGSGAAYTVWTPVAAPTMQAPELNATGLPGALALLATGVLVLTGRRRS